MKNIINISNNVNLIIKTDKCLFFSNCCLKSSMLFDSFDHQQQHNLSRQAWKWYQGASGSKFWRWSIQPQVSNQPTEVSNKPSQGESAITRISCCDSKPATATRISRNYNCLLILEVAATEPHWKMIYFTEQILIFRFSFSSI